MQGADSKKRESSTNTAVQYHETILAMKKVTNIKGIVIKKSAIDKGLKIVEKIIYD